MTGTPAELPGAADRSSMPVSGNDGLTGLSKPPGDRLEEVRMIGEFEPTFIVPADVA